MNYTLVTAKGRTMEFFLLSLAETYQSIYGGVVLYRGRPMLKLVA